MKKILLFTTTLLYSLSYSQTISKFTSDPMTGFTIVNPSAPLDQSPTGTNTTWTFDNLNTVGTSIDTYTTPDATQSSTYPGTTDILTITTQGGTPSASDFFLKEDGSGTSITGAIQGDLTLNYNTTNAFVGLFPISFGTNNSGAVAGTFSYQGNNGTFSGTFTASVDAYGTLTIPGDYSDTVTRLRIDQTLSFSIPPIFNNIGTLNQTTYYYYGNTSNNIDFRYNDITVVSSFLGVNETTETFERNTAVTLSNNAIGNYSFNIYPNPVKDNITINLRGSTNQIIESVSIFNVEGRKVIEKTKGLNTISVELLEKGVYFLALKSKSGSITTKTFIKE